MSQSMTRRRPAATRVDLPEFRPELFALVHDFLGVLDGARRRVDAATADVEALYAADPDGPEVARMERLLEVCQGARQDAEHALMTLIAIDFNKLPRGGTLGDLPGDCGPLALECRGRLLIMHPDPDDGGATRRLMVLDMNEAYDAGLYDAGPGED